jgi:hypothetical protein
VIGGRVAKVWAPDGGSFGGFRVVAGRFFCLAGRLVVFTVFEMAQPGIIAAGGGTISEINEERTYGVLISQARRKLLVALAERGPKMGADLTDAGTGDAGTSECLHYEATLKHLKKMMEAGLVLREEDPADRRRTLYRLSPRIKVSREGGKTLFDFGFGVARLSADGN